MSGNGNTNTGSVGLNGNNIILNGFSYFGNPGETDDKGGYVQATYTLPGVGTKLGVSYGISKSEADVGSNEFKNKSWIVGAYHPLTKSLNLVAEYTDNKIEGTNANVGTDNLDGKAKTISLGAILFF